MATNYVSEGEVWQWTNNTGASVASGQMVKMSHTLGVAMQTIANGATGSVQVEGVFSAIPKVSGAVFVQGEKLVWDVSANGGLGAFDDSAATPASGDLTGAATAHVAGSDGQTTCTVYISPRNATLTA
jgi:predicted RecA/RadA family phage recombinase